MKLRTRDNVFGRRNTRRRMLQAGVGGGFILASPYSVRGQGDNTKDDETDETPEATAEESTSTETTPVADGSALTGGLFPDYRVLLYYGFPDNPNMGILGEYSPEEILPKLQEQAAEYEAADPSRPVKIGFELIASVAQGSAGADDMWVADTDGTWLDQYTEFTAANDMVLFLDVQMGYREPYDDYVGLERWLIKPHVHLGIDPEFHMHGEDEQPGVHLGSVNAEDVIKAQNYLIELAATNNLPRKSLIVHQFDHTMIEDKDQLAPLDGVDLIIDMDGWGPPELKLDTYTVVITNEEIEYNGIKLFYKQDEPLMSAEDILALNPSPDLIIYQ